MVVGVMNEDHQSGHVPPNVLFDLNHHHRRPGATAMSQSSLPTNATQAKDRNYMQLGHCLARLSRAVGQTADLCEMLKVNLDSMKVLSATHAAQ